MRARWQRTRHWTDEFPSSALTLSAYTRKHNRLYVYNIQSFKRNRQLSVCPGLAGGNNGAYAGAFNPDTGLAYVPTIESCMAFEKGIIMFIEGVPFMGGEPVAIDTLEGKSYGHLSAVDVATGEIRWRYQDPHPMMAGVLSTAGGVVITGNAAGYILAFDAATGEERFRFATNSGIRSHPVAYKIDGRVFVAVGSGGGGVVTQITGSPAIQPEGSVLLVFELPQSDG